MKPKPKETRVYKTKSSNGESSKMISFRGMPETHKKLNQLSTYNMLSKTAVIEILIKNAELEVK